jgi:hypothetical protein
MITLLKNDARLGGIERPISPLTERDSSIKLCTAFLMRHGVVTNFSMKQKLILVLFSSTSTLHTIHQQSKNESLRRSGGGNYRFPPSVLCTSLGGQVSLDDAESILSINHS